MSAMTAERRVTGTCVCVCVCVCVCMYMAERRVTGTYTGHMHTQNSLTPGIQRAGEVHGCSSPLPSTRDGTPTQRQAVLLSPAGTHRKWRRRTWRRRGERWTGLLQLGRRCSGWDPQRQPKQNDLWLMLGRYGAMTLRKSTVT